MSAKASTSSRHWLRGAGMALLILTLSYLVLPPAVLSLVLGAIFKNRPMLWYLPWLAVSVVLVYGSVLLLSVKKVSSELWVGGLVVAVLGCSNSLYFMGVSIYYLVRQNEDFAILGICWSVFQLIISGVMGYCLIRGRASHQTTVRPA